MPGYLVDVQVKVEAVDEFVAATEKKRRGALQSRFCQQFEILQDPSDLAHFVLFEVFDSEPGLGSYKQSQSYRDWRAQVEPMMARPRATRSYLLVSEMSKSVGSER